MSAIQQDFLVEIGTEELPPRALRQLSACTWAMSWLSIAGLRGNRLALLSQLRRLFLHTADLSRMQV